MSKLQPVYFGAEWPAVNVWTHNSPPPSAGISGFRFPLGAEIHAYDWDTSVKVDELEVLFNLVCSPVPTFDPAAFVVVPNHHPMGTRDRHRGLNLYPGFIEVPVNWWVWVAISYFGSTQHAVPLEVQGNLFVVPTEVVV